MPSVSPRSRSGRRRAVSEINVVPYIDVMLVLLVIFMVTAPMLPPGSIDLPSAGRSSRAPDAYIEVQVRANGELRVRGVNAGDPTERTVRKRDLPSTISQMRGGAESMPVVISGDKTVRYESVVEVLDELQRMGVRTALMVKPAG